MRFRTRRARPDVFGAESAGAGDLGLEVRYARTKRALGAERAAPGLAGVEAPLLAEIHLAVQVQDALAPQRRAAPWRAERWSLRPMVSGRAGSR